MRWSPRLGQSQVCQCHEQIVFCRQNRQTGFAVLARLLRASVQPATSVSRTGRKQGAFPGCCCRVVALSSWQTGRYGRPGRDATLDNVGTPAGEDATQGPSSSVDRSPYGPASTSSPSGHRPDAMSQSKAPNTATKSGGAQDSGARAAATGLASQGQAGERAGAESGWPQQRDEPLVDDWGYWGWPQSEAADITDPQRHRSAADPKSEPEGLAAGSADAEDSPPYVMEASEVETATELPDLTELTAEEVDQVLPVTPSPEQLKIASGTPYDLYQRIGAAAVVSLLTVKFVLIATVAFLYPFLGPLLKALNRNRQLRSQGRFIALWRATVVECEVLGQQAPSQRLRSQASGRSHASTTRLLVGDPSGARSQLDVAYQPGHTGIQVGEPAELLVLAQRRTFKRFQAIKEIYLPEAGIWVTDYPHINREVFLDLSLSVEQERQSRMRQFEQPSF